MRQSSTGGRRPPAAVSLLVLAALLAAPGAARAQDGELTLADALSRALEHAYPAKIARLTTGQAEDSLREVRGTYLPQAYVSSGAGFSNRRKETIVALDRHLRVREYGLAALASDEGWFNFFVEQLLVDIQQWKLIEREKLAAELARVSESQERERLARDVSSRFAEVVRLQRLEELALRQLEEARGLDAHAQQLFDAGRALESDRDLVSLHLEESLLEAHARAAEAGEARTALWLAIAGEEQAGASLRVSADGLPEPQPGVLPEGAEEAVAGSPEVRVLDLRRRMEEASVSAASARRLPTLGLKAGYTNYGRDRFDLYQDEWRVGIDFRMPLFDGFQARSAVVGAMKGVEIARLRYQSMLETKRSRVRELATRLETAAGRLRLAERRAESSRERQHLTDLRLRSQRATLEEALSARERTAADTREAANSFFNRFELWTALQYEMGRLSSAILGSAASAGTP